jgi:uroporphyrinogen-III synthase
VNPAATPLRVIVTRPEDEARDWVRQLAQAGFAADALPLIGIEPATQPDDRAALAQAHSALPRYAACLFVSGNAVRYFFKGFWPSTQTGRAQAAMKSIATEESFPAALRLLAPGPGTAAALHDAGVPAEQIDTPALDAEQFDSEALWQQIGYRDWAGQRVLIVRGRSGRPSGSPARSANSAEPAAPGRDWIARQWRAAGAQVDFVCVYERVQPSLSAAQLAQAEAASADGSVWLFSSSEAVANLAAAAAVDFSRGRAIATHPRIAQAAADAGWGTVTQSRPALNELIACLRAMKAR